MTTAQLPIGRLLRSNRDLTATEKPLTHLGLTRPVSFATLPFDGAHLMARGFHSGRSGARPEVRVGHEHRSALLARTCCEHQGRGARHVQRPYLLEAGVLQPTVNLFERVRIAGLGIDQHVGGEDQTHQGSGPVWLHKEFGNSDHPPGAKAA